METQHKDHAHLEHSQSSSENRTSDNDSSCIETLNPNNDKNVSQRKFQDLLKTLNSWEETDDRETVIDTLLFDCEKIVKSKSLMQDVDNELVQRVIYVLHDMVCQQTSGEHAPSSLAYSS